MLLISIRLSVTKFLPDQRVDQDGMIQLLDGSSTSTSTSTSTKKSQNKTMHRSGRSAAVNFRNFFWPQKDRHSNSVARKIASVYVADFRYYQRTSDRLHMRRFAEKLRIRLHREMDNFPRKMAIEQRNHGCPNEIGSFDAKHSPPQNSMEVGPQRINLHWKDAELATSLPTHAACPESPQEIDAANGFLQASTSELPKSRACNQASQTHLQLPPKSKPCYYAASGLRTPPTSRIGPA
jgi:hypothetical protein